MTPKKTICLFIFLLLLLLLFSCAPNIPKSDYQVEMEKVFAASFDKTWDAVYEVVNMSKGVIISSDKSSGLVTYAVSDAESGLKIYLNVYLKSLSTPNTTAVYLTPRLRTGTYLKDIERDFFNKLVIKIGGI